MRDKQRTGRQRAAVHCGLQRLRSDLLGDPVPSFLVSSSETLARGGGAPAKLTAGRSPKVHLFTRRRSSRCDINLPWEKKKKKKSAAAADAKKEGRSISCASGMAERLG